MKLFNPNLEADTNGNSNFAFDLNKHEQPKHESIWLGSFLIRTNKKRFDLYRLIGFAYIRSMQTRKGSKNELLFLSGT